MILVKAQVCHENMGGTSEDIIQVAAGGKVHPEAIPSNLDLHTDIPTQIAVQSAYLALGYWRQPDLTQHKFLTVTDQDRSKIYLTGDNGRYLADGNLQYLGRQDSQVKIRGFRIEWHEIESVIKDYDGVDQAIVTYEKDEDQVGFLCAYYVATEAIDLKKLEEFLNQYLPNYMIPGIYERLDAIPLSFNGKADRSALKVTRKPQSKPTHCFR